MQLQLFTVVAVGAAWTPASPVSLSRAGRVAPGVRTAVRLQASDENSALDLEALAKLRERISRIQQSGLATPAQAYFDIATEKPPQRLMREFFMETEPRVQQAMQDAVVSLLGNLPPLQFDSRVSTTGDKLVALMLQLQMTGYMLRNAEYVTKLRELLDIRTRSVDEFRKAFNRCEPSSNPTTTSRSPERRGACSALPHLPATLPPTPRLDEDGSGYLEMGEVQSLMDSFYEGDATAPPYEANALMRLLDANRDGRISWDEFAAALGARKDSGLDPSLKALTGAADGPVTGPQVSGTISVMLEGGKEVQIDAAAYMEQLKAEAEVLRKELNLVRLGAGRGRGEAWLRGGRGSSRPRGMGEGCVAAAATLSWPSISAHAIWRAPWMGKPAPWMWKGFSDERRTAWI